MGIKFKYINYETSFYGHFSNKKEHTQEKLYVFIDNRMKDIFSKKMLGKLFLQPPTLLTFEEFKEKIFFTDKIVLKEAKRILAFFKSLPKNIKEDLGVTTYYDVIDLANNFFYHYKELKRNQVKNLIEYPHWQKKYLNLFEEIKSNFDTFMNQNNYLPNDWLEDVIYFNPLWLKKFSKIVFVDIIEFPKIYIEIFEKLKVEMDIEIVLQMKKGDFDEKNLKLKRASFPSKNKDIQIYIFKEKLEEAISLAYMKEKRKGEIFSPLPEKNNFYEILPNYFAKSQNFTMNDTKLYKFLNLQLEILSSEEERLGGAYLLNDFILAFENPIFKSYYGIEKNDFLSLNNCAFEGYIYISKKIIQDDWFEKNLSEELIEKLNTIFYDLKRVKEIGNSDELYQYFKEELKLENFIETTLDNKDIFDKFFEIFGIIKSNEAMEIHKNFNEYFGNKLGIALYKLLIQYMKDLAIKGNLKSEQSISLIKGIDFVRYSEEKNSINYFIDIADETLPIKQSDNLIFTEKQRHELGLLTADEKREIQRYRFIQAVFSGKDSIIFSQKNEDKAVEISPFLEELIATYSLKINKLPISEGNIIKLLKCELKSTPLININLEDESFEKTQEEFIDNKLELGAYDYSTLSQCSLKFYFKNLANLQYIKKFQVQDLNSRILGIIVHKILEELVNSIWKIVVKNGMITLDEINTFKRVEEAFRKERTKIPLHMDNYCQEIVIPLITKNIIDFFVYLTKKYEGATIRRFQSEKSSFEDKAFYSGKLEVYLKGRADLVIESNYGNEIIDYKTGNKSDGQLDFYSIILYGDTSSGEKGVFNVWNGRIEKEEKIILTKELLEENIMNFVESSVYSRAEKKSPCINCEYKNICGKRGEV